MPMPTDRRGRYHFYRKRALKRARRWNTHTYDAPETFNIFGFRTGGNRRKWILKNVFLLKSKAEYLRPSEYGPLLPAPPPSLAYVIAPAAYRLPPYVAFVFPPPDNDHYRQEVIGYFKRRVKHRGKKIDAKPGLNRIAFGAKAYWRRWGVYPHWDPWLRTPYEWVEWVADNPAYAYLETQR